MTRETITLQYPVTVDGEEYTEVSLRRIKGADLKRVEKYKGSIDKSFRMIADLAEISIKVVEELDAVDITEIGAKVGELMGAVAE